MAHSRARAGTGRYLGSAPPHCPHPPSSFPYTGEADTRNIERDPSTVARPRGGMRRLRSETPGECVPNGRNGRLGRGESDARERRGVAWGEVQLLNPAFFCKRCPPIWLRLGRCAEQVTNFTGFAVPPRSQPQPWLKQAPSSSLVPDRANLQLVYSDTLNVQLIRQDPQNLPKSNVQHPKAERTRHRADPLSLRGH